jgi:hypothetical protein
MVQEEKHNIWSVAVIEAHEARYYHKEILQKSEKCGCFFCLAQFNFEEIKEWWDDENTAGCPVCGYDTVIGSASNYPIEYEFLKAMKEYWL